MVHVQEEAQSSPHVVDFKKDKKQETWPHMPIYREQMQKVSGRKVVDFAEMVRQANSRTTEQHVNRTARQQNSVEISVFTENKKTKRQREQFRLPRFSFLCIPHALYRMRDSMSSGWSSCIHACRERELKIRNGFLTLPKRFVFSVRYNLIQTVSVVIVLALLIGLPFPTISYYQKVKADTEKIVEESTNAFLSLQSSTVAALNTNLLQAEYDLNAALVSFGAAENLIEKGEDNMTNTRYGMACLIGTL